MIRSLVLIELALLVLLAAACDGRDWRTKDVSGMLPALEFSLSSTKSGQFTADELRGETVLLFFGFTSCPDVCPNTMARLTALRQSLPATMRDQVRIVFVSVDPVRDTPERLAAYRQHFGEGIISVTGKRDELRQLARRYRTTFAYSEPDENGHYDVSHSSGVYVFDTEGRAQLLFRPDDSLQAMQSDLQQLLR